jgi:hypothetical protein
MAKKNNKQKPACQTSLDFNQNNPGFDNTSNVVLSEKTYDEKNCYAKVIYFDSRQELYKKILDRQMK